jgi:hypothetical protein
MSVSLYTASVPVFRQMLASLSHILGKAQTWSAEKKIDPSALLQARLYPDMFPLTRQVQIACSHARGAAARLTGAEIPGNDDKEQSFDDLLALVARTLAYLDTVKPEQFEGSENREIVLRAGTPSEKKLQGQNFLLNFAIPQFFFHTTTTYAILRHNGLDVGKRDYMGVY